MNSVAQKWAKFLTCQTGCEFDRGAGAAAAGWSVLVRRKKDVIGYAENVILLSEEHLKMN